MRRLASALGLLVVPLVAAPAAGAWTTVGTGLDNTVDPAVVVLKNGTELVAFREPKAHAVVVGSHVVVKGLASVGDPRVVQLPTGDVVLFVADENGVESWTSTNDGKTWIGPAPTGSHDVGDVQSAAVLGGGRPFFTQGGTGFVNVYEGTAAPQNMFTHCCGYGESVAVDSHGVAQIAFWSNARGHAGYLYGKLGGPLRTLSPSSAQDSVRVPLVPDGLGNAFVGYAGGSPASSFVVATLKHASIAHKVTLATGPFTGNEPLMALAVDASDRLWAVWTRGGTVWAARSRSHGAHFGASVHVAEPGAAYALEAAARADGSVDAVVNDGTAIKVQKIWPGLTVQVAGRTVRVLDDGFPVAGATVHAAGATAKTDASGRATFAATPAHVSVTAAGYAAY